MTSTSSLCAVGQAEFRRLVRALESRGCLDKADPGIITSAARLKALVDSLHKSTASDVSEICQAENAYLGRLRALGLPLQPSRIHVRTIGSDSQKQIDPIAAKIKLHA